MAQIVIEFGATTVDPVFTAILGVIEQPTRLDVEPRSGAAFSVSATDGEIKTAYRQFTRGEIISVTIRTGFPDIRYGLLLCPHFGGQELSLWLGTIELTTDNWRPYWNKLLRFDGLVVVCAGEEEGVELTDGNLTVASFPWEEWPLLVAALREGAAPKSDWVIRERTTAATG